MSKISKFIQGTVGSIVDQVERAYERSFQAGLTRPREELIRDALELRGEPKHLHEQQDRPGQLHPSEVALMRRETEFLHFGYLIAELHPELGPKTVARLAVEIWHGEKELK